MSGENSEQNNRAFKESVLERSVLLQAVIREIDSGILTTHSVSEAQADLYTTIKALYPTNEPMQKLYDVTFTTLRKDADLLLTQHDMLATSQSDNSTSNLGKIIEKMLLFIGYQVGNSKDVTLFLPELTDFLVAYDAKHEQGLFTQSARDNLSNVAYRQKFCQQILAPILTEGANFRLRLFKYDASLFLSPRKRESQYKIDETYTKEFGLEDSLDPCDPPILYRREGDASGADVPQGFLKAFKNQDFNL